MGMILLILMKKQKILNNDNNTIIFHKYIYMDYFDDLKRPCKIMSDLNYYTNNSYY